MMNDSETTAGELALHRGITTARAGFNSVATAHLERAAELSPDDPNVWLWLAWVATSPDNARRCLERVLELAPQHPVATAGIAWIQALTTTSETPASDSAAGATVDPLDEHDSGCDVSLPEPLVINVVSCTSGVCVFQAMTGDAPVADDTRPADADRCAAAEIDTAASDANSTVGDAPPAGQPNEDLSPPPEVDAVNTVAAETRSDDAIANRRRWTDWTRRDSVAAAPPTKTFAGDAEAIELERTDSGSAATPTATESEFADVESLTHDFQPTVSGHDSNDKPLVMVVDDSPTVRKLVSLTLERRGYRVISAFDGLAAIKELAACRPDLILLDINMPRLDGYRLCKLIKKHEATQNIPVVMLSGKDGMFDKLRGRLVGCSDYITKPFEADALTHKVAKYLTTMTSTTV